MPRNSADYPPDWADIVRRVKDRAGWVCEWCGARTANRTPTPPSAGRGPHQPRPSRRPRGDAACVCQRCHLRPGRRPSSPNRLAPPQQGNRHAGSVRGKAGGPSRELSPVLWISLWTESSTPPGSVVHREGVAFTSTKCGIYQHQGLATSTSNQWLSRVIPWHIVPDAAP